MAIGMRAGIRWMMLMLLLAGGAAGRTETQPSPFGESAAPAASLRGSSSVKAELLADSAAVQPGRPFKLGVRFTLQPGWHIYWRTPGDVGQETRIEWGLPAGFKAGELQWPTPERIEQDGLISYAYENSVLLMATVTPPAGDAGKGPFNFTAKVRWIACQESCVPGKADLALTLPAGTAAPGAAAGEFERAAALVPVELKTAKTDRFEVAFAPSPIPKSGGREEKIDVTVTAVKPWRLDEAAGAPTPALFPVATGDWTTSHPKLLERGAERVRFAWPVTWNAEGKSTDSQLRAVLRLPLTGGEGGAREVARVIVAAPTDNANAGQTPSGASMPGAKADEGVRAPKETSESDRVFSFYQGNAQAAPPLWRVLLLAFLGGMILNVMPCVLPVLSLKVLGFVRQAGEDRGRRLRLGLAYTLGVLASFAALGAAVIALRAAGLQIGQGFQLQDPRFVAIMAAVVFALGLSLLGVYTIELPGAAVNRADQLGRREGYPGAILSGVLSTALATPCTAPFLGTALAVAFAQPPALALLIFLTAGLGLAAPYLLLSSNPGWLRFVPKPGRWMLVFEQLMGFVMLGFVIWLLGVLGRLAGTAALIGTLGFLLLVAVGCWMLGLGERFGLRRPMALATMAAGFAIAVSGYFLFPERYLRDTTRGGDATPPATAAEAGGIRWEPFSVARVEQLVKDGRTVFVDFTADWCLTCKVNEARTLQSARVRDLFSRYNVAAVKADWTNYDPAIARTLRQFGSAGVPLYVIFPAGRPDQPRVLPTLISPELIERHLGEVAPQVRSAKAN